MMSYRSEASENRALYRGVIHFHSDFSHDAHDALEDIADELTANSIDFCIITDHFEDFDAAKFARYLENIRKINERGKFVFVPAIEAEFEGFHIIFLPVASFDEVQQSVENADLTISKGLKFLAHPTKYPLEDVSALLRDHALDGIEVWNQQADGKYTPPVEYLRKLLPNLPASARGFFFGNDIHNINHAVSNHLLVPADSNLTPEYIVQMMRQRAFSSASRLTGTSLEADSSIRDLATWLDHAVEARGPKAVLRGGLSHTLKFGYHLLPKPVQKHINDFKNSVKSRL